MLKFLCYLGNKYENFLSLSVSPCFPLPFSLFHPFLVFPFHFSFEPSLKTLRRNLFEILLKYYFCYYSLNFPGVLYLSCLYKPGIYLYNLVDRERRSFYPIFVLANPSKNNLEGFKHEISNNFCKIWVYLWWIKFTRKMFFFHPFVSEILSS